MKASLIIFLIVASFTSARADVTIDVTIEQLRVAGDNFQLDDLSVNDTAYLYGSFCYEDNKLFLPENVRSLDFAGDTYDASGVAYQVKVLPGRKVSVRIVDARQTQLVARGNPSAPPVLTRDELKEAVLRHLSALFFGRFFASPSCAVQRNEASLVPLGFFTVESINGYTSLSALIKSLD